ncbi:MAG: insulinase family protein [Planctomycetes bacterium]|nr:insulinase family protein [Planctomycetota bacterium]
MKFEHTQLANGLMIIGEVNPSAASMAAGFFVRTGSRDETPDIAGASHFLEHMMFKGSSRRSPFDINRDFDAIGANYNAATSEENTVYHGAVLPEFDQKLLDILADMLRPALRQDDFDTEKNVILEEIARYEDMPRFRVYDKLMSEFFAGHPLGQSVLGTRQSIGGLTSGQMRDYFDRRYSPDNITAVGVGNFDFGRFVSKIDDLCHEWRPAQTSRAIPPPPNGRRRRVIVDRKLVREQVGLMIAGPAAQDDRRYAASLAAAIAGDDTGSRLYYALVEPAIADEAAVEYNPMDQAGVFLTAISAEPAQAKKAVNIALDEFGKLRSGGPTEDELSAAKNKIASGAAIQGELPMGRLAAVGFDWIYRKQYLPLAGHIDCLLAVTKDQVMDVLRQYDLSAPTMVSLGPLEAI